MSAPASATDARAYAPQPYRLTRPDGLGFFRRRSLPQFVLACVGLGLGLLAVVVGAAGVGGRIGLGIAGGLLVGLAFAKAPSGEDALELLGPIARWCRHATSGRHRFAAALSPVGGAVPPLFAGIALYELDTVAFDGAGAGSPTSRRSSRTIGVIADRADGSVSVVLRVHGEGFLLADGEERDARVDAFGVALASLAREDGVVSRVSWSQLACPAGVDDHLAYLAATSRDDPDEQLRSSYLDLVADTAADAVRTEVLVTLTSGIGRVGRGSTALAAAARRLCEEAERFSAELSRGGLVAAGPLPAGAVARSLRERLDPGAAGHLDRRGRSIAAVAGLVAPENAFPLSIEEHRRFVRVDGSLHQVFRVAEWPKVAVRADWLASFLCETAATRSFTVSFIPQPRRLAHRQALAVATRVGANIDERETKGRRVGAEERRAMLAAEALDEELEAGAAMELLVGLVDVTAPDEEKLRSSAERVLQEAANLGMELRRVDLRHGEALVCALPLGRLVGGRAR